MIIAWLLAGAAAAVVGVLGIRRTVLRLGLGSSSRAMVRVIGGAAIRLALAGVVLVAAIHQGILSGLAAFLGLWIGRWATIWYLAKRQGPLGASGT